MGTQMIHHPKAHELNILEEIKKQAKLENNRAKYDEAQEKIRQIISENQLQITNDFQKLPLEQQIVATKIKIRESKILGDSNSLQYWTNTLNDLNKKLQEQTMNNQNNIKKLDTKNIDENDKTNIKEAYKSKQEEKVNQEVNEIEVKKENIIVENKQNEEIKEDEQKQEKIENSPQQEKLKVIEKLEEKKDEQNNTKEELKEEIDNLNISQQEKNELNEKLEEKEIEQKQEKEIEQKQENVKKEKAIKKTREGEKTLITYYEDGDIRVSSDYMSIRTTYPNTKIISAGFGISLALADIGAFNSINEELETIMNNAKTEDDFNALLDYSNKIRIGSTGEKIASQIENYVSQKKQQIEKNKEVKEEIKGKNTTYTKTNDTITLTSKFLSININTHNQELHDALDKLLPQIALFEIDRADRNTFNNTFQTVLNNIKSEQDKKDILDFAKEIDKLDYNNPIAFILKESAKYENNEKQEEKQPENINQTSIIDKITKKRDILDMQYDEIMQESPIETDDLYMISGKYNNLADEIASYLNDNNISTEDRSSIEDIINELDRKAEGIRITADKAEELGNALSY